MNTIIELDEAKASALLYSMACEAVKSLNVFTRSDCPSTQEDIDRTERLIIALEEYEKVFKRQYGESCKVTNYRG